MFEKIGRMAETAATNVSTSRRGFLRWLGQRALAAIGVLGGAFVCTQDARAGGSVICCKYRNEPWCGNPYGGKFVSVCYPAGTTCPPCLGVVNGGCAGCFLQQQSTKQSCGQCG